MENPTTTNSISESLHGSMSKHKNENDESQAVTPSMWGFIAPTPKDMVLRSDIPKRHFALWGR